jgi:hypothetical protein
MFVMAPECVLAYLLRFCPLDMAEIGFDGLLGAFEIRPRIETAALRKIVVMGMQQMAIFLKCDCLGFRF